MQPPARCSNHRCVYIDQCEYILKDFGNAPPAKMLIYCQKIYYVKNKIDKSRHFVCIHYENRNAVVYGCRDIAIILRQP